jgi:hypothetical protein
MNDEINDHAAAYDFVQLGEKLADALVRAAEDQVNKAQHILDQTKSMAEIVRTQVAAQAKQIEEMTERFKEFGTQMIDAHRKLNGDDHAIAPADLVKLRAVADAAVSRDPVTPHRPIAPRPDHLAPRERIPRLTKNSDGRDELHRQVAAGEPYAPWVNSSGHDVDRPGGTGS